MKKPEVVLICAVLAFTAGCAFNFGGDKQETLPIGNPALVKTDIYAHESRTLSVLAALESAVSDYVRNEGKIPDRLEYLVPKYLADIPSVELGQPEVHNDSNRVEYYPSGVIQKGILDESQLKDVGTWGYVHTDRQVIVFVSCTHIDSRGKPWYKERGAF